MPARKCQVDLQAPWRDRANRAVGVLAMSAEIISLGNLMPTLAPLINAIESNVFPFLRQANQC